MSVNRTIKSYVLRQGRMTPSQQRAFTENWPRFGLALPNEVAPLDWPEVFNRQAPLVLEIGFGMGEALLAAAKAHPENNYIGVEVHPPGVGRVLNQAANHELTQLRIFKNDVHLVLARAVAPNSLDKVQIYFPDPWPKKRHHKRRLIQPEFIPLVAERLKPKGILHLATDWPAYALHMQSTIEENTDLQPVTEPLLAQRFTTRFEHRGKQLGHPIDDLVFEKVS